MGRLGGLASVLNDRARSRTRRLSQVRISQAGGESRSGKVAAQFELTAGAAAVHQPGKGYAVGSAKQDSGSCTSKCDSQVLRESQRFSEFRSSDRKAVCVDSSAGRRRKVCSRFERRCWRVWYDRNSKQPVREPVSHEIEGQSVS